eukprot:Hpha_TRINITY_DN14172_c0_g1::TRINITY_DN14172_c0_g1_i5::g.10860::m.10860
MGREGHFNVGCVRFRGVSCDAMRVTLGLFAIGAVEATFTASVVRVVQQGTSKAPCGDSSSNSDFALQTWLWSDVDPTQSFSGCLYQKNAVSNQRDITGSWSAIGPTAGVTTLYARVEAMENDESNANCINGGADGCYLDKTCTQAVTPGSSGSFTCTDGVYHTIYVDWTYPSVAPSLAPVTSAPTEHPSTSRPTQHPTAAPQPGVALTTFAPTAYAPPLTAWISGYSHTPSGTSCGDGSTNPGEFTIEAWLHNDIDTSDAHVPCTYDSTTIFKNYSLSNSVASKGPTPGATVLTIRVRAFEDDSSIGSCSFLSSSDDCFLDKTCTYTVPPGETGEISCGDASHMVYVTYNAGTNAPTISPSIPPTMPPTYPTVSPTAQPTLSPSPHPSVPPTLNPTTTAPSKHPTAAPSSPPTTGPLTSAPSANPSVQPTRGPTVSPSAQTAAPSVSPSGSPSLPPSSSPSVSPSKHPTAAPSSPPTTSPLTSAPSAHPSVQPTGPPTVSPRSPTLPPSAQPSTSVPSVSPSLPPTAPPSVSPKAPTGPPSVPPSLTPSEAPSHPPSATPTTSAPSISPVPGITVGPTMMPTTSQPTVAPATSQPSGSPSL